MVQLDIMKLLSNRRAWLKPVTWVVGYLVLAGSLLTWRLGTLAPAGALESASCRANDLSTPGGIVMAVTRQLSVYDCDPAHAIWLRLPAVALALLAGGLFVWAIRLWLGRLAAIYGGILFVSSAWFLHAGRFSGIQAAMLLTVPIVLWLWRFVPRYRGRAWLGYVVAVTMAVLVSLPGGIWFALLLAALKGKAVVTGLGKQKAWQTGLQYLLFFVCLAPLIYAMVTMGDKTNVLSWLGVSELMAVDPVGVTKQLLDIPSQLFLHGPEQISLWLPGLPVLDILTAVMAIIGIVWLVMRLKTESRLLIICTLVLAIAFTGLGGYGAGQLSIIVPFLYFAATAGLRFLLHRWRQTFPRNPFARGLAYGLLSIAILASVTYNLRAYFVAWPHNPAVLNSFRERR